MSNDYKAGYEDGIEAGRVIANQMYLDGASAISNIMEWHKDKKTCDKPFNSGTALYLLLEEIFEGIGLDNEHGKKLASKYANYIKAESETDEHEEEHESIDWMADMCVYLFQFMMQKGYHPVKVLEQVFIEINSRTGEFNEAKGKWEKYKTDEAKALWVTADYTKARL